MNTERWLEVKRILTEALALSEETRAAFLDVACGSDAELRQEVESLLAFEAAPMDSPVFQALPESEAVAAQENLGPWRLLDEIGRGGMGVVYRGERADRLFDKQVAVKLLESHLQPEELMRRFAAERRILASLEHPNIARLLDAGVRPGGNPYLVMELVDGVPLDRYLETTALTLEARLRLFLAVCDAVTYAHRQLVVHLDLKPSNILVEPSGTPKLMDFGLAKVVDPVSGDSGERTSALFRIFTPSYASPEQLSGAPLTVSADVYSLGVILYELIAGKRPYEVTGLPIAEATRLILEKEPTPPTKDDLNNIVLKALEKDPARRYPSVEQLGEDLRRYLDGMPVLAREQTFGYRLRKFARRRKSLTILATVSVLSVLIGGGATWYQARVAERRFAMVRRLSNEFLFEFHDSIKDLPGAMASRRMVLDKARQYLEALAADAGSNTELLRELAASWSKLGEVEGTYFESNLGETDHARECFLKARDLYERVANWRPFDPKAKVDLGDAYTRIATSYSGAHQHKEALAMLELAEKAYLSAPIRIPPVDIGLARVHFGRAENYENLNRIEDALRERELSLDGMAKMAAKRPGDKRVLRPLAMAKKRFASTLMLTKGQEAKALGLIEEALAVDEAALAAEPTSAQAQLDVAMSRSYRSTVLFRLGRREDAHADLALSTKMRKTMADADPKDVRAFLAWASDIERAAEFLAKEGKPREALEQLDLIEAELAHRPAAKVQEIRPQVDKLRARFQHAIATP